MFEVKNSVQHQTTYKIGDLVRHKTTGMTGKVIGYGHRLVSDRYYSTTLKVELKIDSSSPIQPLAEDIMKKWKLKQDRQILACTLPHFPKPSLSKKLLVVNCNSFNN